MPIAVHFLEQNGQPPHQVAALLAEFLAAARSSLHLAIYDFRLGDSLAEPVIKALRGRIAAGVEVRIAYDAGKWATSLGGASTEPAPTGSADFIRSIDPRIFSKAITGGDPATPKLMHHKYVIRDGTTPAGAVWTGSTNFTDDSWTLQENNIVCIDSADLCTYYETDFEELWSRGDIGTSGRHDNGTLHVPEARIDVAFAPGEGRSIDHEVAHFVGTARRRLKVCSMVITAGSILGALSDTVSHGRVADYSGLYDRTQMESVFSQWHGTPAEWKIQAFQQAAGQLSGKRSTPYNPGSKHDFMHNKLLVADDAVITGSYNLSHSATLNAENMVIMHSPEIADRYSAYIDRLAERYRRDLRSETKSNKQA